MINNRYRQYVQYFLLVLPMTGLVTAVNTAVARGIESVLTTATFERWMISFIIAFPTVLVIAPFVMKLTNRIVKND